MFLWYGMLVSMSFLYYGEGGGCVVGEERKEIHWKKSTLFWSCLTFFHHPSLINLQKQAVHDIRREERLR